MKTILIDDEPLAIVRLKRLLAKYDNFEIIAEAKNGGEGLELVENLRPDVIFLDIEMPVMSGFEILSKLSFMPLVVFATAFDQYAIRAFEENSIDYLLKPIEAERLEKTVEKLQKFHQKPAENSLANPFNANLLQMLEQFKPKKEIHSISVKSGEKILFIPLAEISHFEAEDKYVFMNTTDGQQYLTSYTIAVLEEKLPENFVRVSRSSIVNSLIIKELQRGFNGKYIILMKDRKMSKIETGNTYNDNLKRLMEI
jgi:two-component system, LytTR family, response regulator